MQDGDIDAASFTNIRLASGAIVLLILLTAKSSLNTVVHSGSWTSAFMLFLYAVCFSYAYIELGAGMGALILFALVQATMVIAALLAGERPTLLEIVGWVFAAAGLVYLLLPGAEAASLTGSVLMAVSGIAWGVYSIRGARESAPLASTTSNFTRSLVFVLLLMLGSLQAIELSQRGVLLAVASGAVTSGVGYVIWYAALRHLRTLQAALVQLSVPAIAALGGVLLLAEPLTLRLTLSGVLILGGISIAMIRKAGRA